jgi:anti-anti-sigma factor
MARDGSFHCELETSHLKDKDESGNQVTIVKCHGELVCGTADQLKERVRPLIPIGGRIILDLGDVKHLDSAGLGALVGLKTSAIKQGECKLELANMTPGVLELLRITHLTQLFAQ